MEEREFLGQRLVACVGVEEVEEGFVLEKNEAKGVFAVGRFEKFESFFFGAGAGATQRHTEGRGTPLALGCLSVLPAPLRHGPAASALKGMVYRVGRGSVEMCEKPLLQLGSSSPTSICQKASSKKQPRNPPGAA
jgi:hypothetical protein